MNPPTTTSDSHLLSIPLEVLLQITSYLPTTAYCSLRRTCKHVEQQLYPSFAREYFTKRQFMLSEFSLQALVDISKSRFSSSLRYLVMGLDRPPLPRPDINLDANYRNQWVDAVAGYTTFIASGQDAEMLTEAISNLKALETVGIRDFNSRTRWRDHPNNEWRSKLSDFLFLRPCHTYPMVIAMLFSHLHHHCPNKPVLDQSSWCLNGTISPSPLCHLRFMIKCREAGILPIPFRPTQLLLDRRSFRSVADISGYGSSEFTALRNNHISVSGYLNEPDDRARIFIKLLRTLGKVGSKAQNIEVILRHTTIPDQAFHLPPYLLPIVSPVLVELRRLFLDLNCNFPSPGPVDTAMPFENKNYYLQKFLAQTPNLEHLRLNFQGFPSDPTLQHLQWLFHLQEATVAIKTSSAVKSSYESTIINLPKLRELDLGFLQTTPATLLKLVRKFKDSLRTLSLHRINLLPNPGVQEGIKENLWVKFLEDLPVTKVQLNSINLSFLSQSIKAYGSRYDVNFTDSKDKKGGRWSGTDMNSAVQKFAQITVVNWPEVESESDSSSDDDDDDDDDEDMDDEDNMDVDEEL